MPDFNIGFVSIIRTTFDVPLAESVTTAAMTALQNAGYTLVMPERPVTTLDEALGAADLIAAGQPDLLLVLQATFADSAMIAALAARVDAPLLLWGVPEAHSGGRLRLNSLCGINLGLHALTRSGMRASYLFAAPDDPAALDEIAATARAAHALRRLKSVTIGRVGENPAGFETCISDPVGLRAQFGVTVEQIDLRQDVFAAVPHADTAVVDAVEQRVRQRAANYDSVDAEVARKTLSAYATLRAIAAQRQIDGFAVRCWPEFFTELGCAACGAMSLLTDDGTPCSCEADVNGTLTQIILQTLSGTPAFGSDIVSLDAERDALVLWHCGLAPLAMADDANDSAPIGVTLHSNRKQPLLLDFALKPGVVTVARLSHATGSFRLVIGRAEIIRAPKAFSGTSGMIRFARPARAVLDTILSEGLEHHISLTYGDHAASLRALARMLNSAVLEL
jgi:L-fucose isomerase-like protein